MPISPHPSMLVWVGVAAVVAWRLYARIRRMVGRQRFSNRRPWITICLFPALIALLTFSSISHSRFQPESELGMLAGIAVGVMLGIWGLRLTRFEQTPAGLFYTPNLHLGIALSVLFIGRIVYRIVQLSMIDPSTMGSPADFSRSPLTLVIFGTLAGYYVTYAIGLLRWSRRVGDAPGIVENQA